MSFVIPYTLTFVVGLLRGSNTLAYALHPLFGMLTLVLPIIVYALSKEKKVIKGMIKSNFNLKGKPVVKVAKLSTQVILGYFLFSVVTGFIINNSLYGTPGMYSILSSIHGVARFLVPLAMIAHVVARIMIKQSSNR